MLLQTVQNRNFLLLSTVSCSSAASRLEFIAFSYLDSKKKAFFAAVLDNRNINLRICKEIKRCASD